MSTPPRILVATDLEDASAGAVATAARLASTHGAAVHVLHVVEEDLLASLVHLLGGAQAPGARKLHDEQEVGLARAVAVVARASSAEPTRSIVVGAPHGELLKAAGALGADLVVLGRRATPTVRGLLLGSTAERVLDAATWPVLCVRRADGAPWKRVVVPVDFSPRSGAAVSGALRWAPGADVLLVHAYAVPFEMKLRHAGLPDGDILHMQAQARAEALALLDGLVASLVPAETRARVQVRAVHGEAGPAVLAEATTWGADLLVMGKRGHGAAADLLLGSVTRHVLGETACDVLVTPGGAE